ncbi:MAG: heavy metal translocating P-type ATPase [Planctomycetota bacterium]|nr:heavy metal translocating P-type ATPase [Planctomycetota bacterium]
MSTTLDYKISGMTCENCVQQTRNAFQQVLEEGTAKVEVSLEEGRASVVWPHEDPGIERIRELFKDAGIEVEAILDDDSEKTAMPHGDANAEERTSAKEKVAAPDALLPLLMSVSGMTCASCVRHVEKALLTVPGSEQASVNLATASAKVMLPAHVDPEDAYKAVLDAGFTAGPIRAVGAAAEDQSHPWLAFTLAAIPVALMVLLSLFGASKNVVLWVQFLGASFALLGPGRPILVGGFRNLFRGKPDMNSLVALGLFAAFTFSLAHFFLSGDANQSLMFKEAAMLLLFILFGRALEHRAKDSAFGTLSKLLSDEPKKARRVEDGQVEEVAVSELKRGDQVLIERGSRAPVDGILIEGDSAFDESLITGESLPVQRQKGDPVIAGAINCEGPVTMIVTRAGAESTLRQLVALVSQAQAEKAPIQRYVDKVASVFVPIVLGIALLTLATWLLLGESWSYALSHFVAVLVVACPCALGLATPTAIVVGSGLALRHGILVKSAGILESLSKLGLLAFDKTGTLTEGKPKVTSLLGDKEKQGDAVALAKQSQHPLSKAIAQSSAASEASFRLVKEIPGLGIKGKTQSREAWALGALDLLIQEGMTIPEDLAQSLKGDEVKGCTLVYFGQGSELCLVFALRDQPRPEAAGLLSYVKSQGLETCLLTGDRESAAKFVAEELGLANWKASLRPEQKLEQLDELKKKTAPRLVAMFGDGINDAPALARADVGISLADGTDVAREAGDIILLNPGLGGFRQVLEISRATLRKIRQNLVWATVYNLAGIPLAAGVLTPWGLELTPSFAGLAMAFSSVSVVTNSLLLNRFKVSRALLE